jgi:hypothetical protein
LSCLKQNLILLNSLQINFTVRPKNVLRRKRLSATAIKHVPSNIINERSALFGNSVSSLDITEELLVNKSEVDDDE